jgi:hypothetical protein
MQYRCEKTVSSKDQEKRLVTRILKLWACGFEMGSMSEGLSLNWTIKCNKTHLSIKKWRNSTCSKDSESITQ